MRYLYAVSIKQLVWFALFFLLVLSDGSSGQSLSDAERLRPGTRFFVTSDLHRLGEQIPKTSVYRLWQSPELGQFWTFAKSNWLEAVVARYPKEQKAEKPTAYPAPGAKELFPLIWPQIDRFAGPISIAIVENSSAHRGIASLIIVHLLKDEESTDIVQSVFQSQIDAGEMRIEAQQGAAGNPLMVRLFVSHHEDTDANASTARESVGYATVLRNCLVLTLDLSTVEQLLDQLANPIASAQSERFELLLTYWGDVQGVLYIDFKSVVRFIAKWLAEGGLTVELPTSDKREVSTMDSETLQRLDALFDQYLFEITTGFSADDQGTLARVRSPTGMFWLPWFFSVK